MDNECGGRSDEEMNEGGGGRAYARSFSLSDADALVHLAGSAPRAQSAVEVPEAPRPPKQGSAEEGDRRASSKGEGLSSLLLAAEEGGASVPSTGLGLRGASQRDYKHLATHGSTSPPRASSTGPIAPMGHATLGQMAAQVQANAAAQLRAHRAKGRADDEDGQPSSDRPLGKAVSPGNELTGRWTKSEHETFVAVTKGGKGSRGRGSGCCCCSFFRVVVVVVVRRLTSVCRSDVAHLPRHVCLWRYRRCASTAKSGKRLRPWSKLARWCRRARTRRSTFRRSRSCRRAARWTATTRTARCGPSWTKTTSTTKTSAPRRKCPLQPPPSATSPKPLRTGPRRTSTPPHTPRPRPRPRPRHLTTRRTVTSAPTTTCRWPTGALRRRANNSLRRLLLGAGFVISLVICGVARQVLVRGAPWPLGGPLQLRVRLRPYMRVRRLNVVLACASHRRCLRV